jgi:hypothetical protein
MRNMNHTSFFAYLFPKNLEFTILRSGMEEGTKESGLFTILAVPA